MKPAFTLQATDGRTFSIDGEARLGSDPACRIFLVDPHIAPFHATAYVRDNTLFLRDERAARGTFVNDQRLEAGQTVRLLAGDRVRLAREILVVTQAGGQAATSPLSMPADDKTAFGLPPPLPQAPPASALRLPDGRELEVTRELRVGRSPLCDIVLDDARVSGHHATLWVQRGILLIRDEYSTNGTFVDEARAAPGQPVPLRPGDTLRLGQSLIEIVKASGGEAAPGHPALPETPTFIHRTVALPLVEAALAAPDRLVLRGPDGVDYPVRGETVMGRETGSDIKLIDPRSSRRHAVVWVQHGALMVRDENSRNGTFVNGVRIPPEQATALRPGDTLKLADSEFLLLEPAPGA